jgi:hypothetical protein
MAAYPSRSYFLFLHPIYISQVNLLGRYWIQAGQIIKKRKKSKLGIWQLSQSLGKHARVLQV